MRCKNILPALIFFVVFLLLCSQTLATKSRLLGMGDLSIVIEDESNMINLWDFARNPAGLLDDETGSVLGGDFLHSSENPRCFSAILYQYPHGMFTVQEVCISNGELYGSVRQKENFAVGFRTNFCNREVEGQNYEFGIKTSNFALYLDKYLAPKTSLGLALEFSEFDNSWDKSSAEDFGAKIGLANQVSDFCVLGVVLAYGKFNPNKNFYDVSDARYLDFSLQSFFNVQNKLRMGIETVLAYRKMDRGWSSYNHWLREDDNPFYSTFLKFRGIYQFSSSLAAGLYYNDNDLFVSFFDPYYDFFRFPEYNFMIRHLGLGGVYRLRRVALVGVEYHFKDTAQERGMFQNHRLTKESLNIGIEILPRERLALRGGYIRKEIRENPINEESKQGWRNILTIGAGYEFPSLKLSLDFAYRYTWGTTEIWAYSRRYEPGESERNILAISMKKLL